MSKDDEQEPQESQGTLRPITGRALEDLKAWA